MTDESIAAHVTNLTPETFNFAQDLVEREYAEDTIAVVLNEKLGYAVERAREALDAARTKDDIKSAEEKYKKAREEARAHTYTLTLRGISEERREELLKESIEQYPLEYDKYVNALTGGRIREELPNPERDRIYTNMLWAEQIVKIEDSKGRVQNDVSVSDVAIIRARAPLSAQERIAKLTEKLRVVSDWQDRVLDEDF